MPAGPTTYPAALSERSAPMLGRGERGATVMAVSPLAIYLRVNGFEPPGLLPVVAADALRLPNALVLGSAPPQVGWGVQPGDRVMVGNGRVRLPGATIRRVRVWRPVPVVPSPQQRLVPAPSILARLSSQHWLAPAQLMATAAMAGDPLDALVEVTVGSGPGLTPSGDDMICGVMLALRLAGEADAVARLWRAVRPRLSRTTAVSDCLLAEAAQGYAVPAVVRLTAALGGGTCTMGEVSEAARAVTTIGHTSGADLLAGIAGGLAAVDARRGAGVVLEMHGSRDPEAAHPQRVPTTPPGAGS